MADVSHLEATAKLEELPIRPTLVNNLDEARRSSIATALQQYRETVMQHNLFSVRTLVEGMEARPLPAQHSAKSAQYSRMQTLRRFLRGTVPASVESPRYLFENNDVRSMFVKSACLEGVSYCPVNMKRREEFFAAIRTPITEKNVEVAGFPPADLEHLCTLVSAITGSGLPLHKEVSQFHFLSPIEHENLGDIAEGVIVPIGRDEEGFNALSFVWEEWEIAIAFKIGGGPDIGGSYALYSRNADREEWQWRFGIHDGEEQSDIYDTVEEFLAFYSHFHEETEEAILRQATRLFGKLPKSE